MEPMNRLPQGSTPTPTVSALRKLPTVPWPMPQEALPQLWHPILKEPLTICPFGRFSCATTVISPASVPARIQPLASMVHPNGSPTIDQTGAVLNQFSPEPLWIDNLACVIDFPSAGNWSGLKRTCLGISFTFQC